MRKNKVYSIIALLGFMLAVMIGCAPSNQFFSQNKTYTDDELGLRKTTILNETTQVIEDINYTQEPAGTSTRFERSYENAPPLIPHSTEDMLPITSENNICLGCHLPDVAADVGATPMPKSHFFSIRTGKDLNGKMDEERFNCNQCHVPQANVQPLVTNNFKPDFRNQNSKEKSNLLDVINEGVR